MKEDKITVSMGPIRIEVLTTPERIIPLLKAVTVMISIIIILMKISRVDLTNILFLRNLMILLSFAAFLIAVSQKFGCSINLINLKIKN